MNKGLQGGSDISVSGGSTTSNLWLVDGADNVDHGSNRTILVYPSVDAIEEFKIQRNNYGAEFGQAGGAQVNLVTKRRNQHLPRHRRTTSLRRDSLNSTDYFLEQAGQGAGAPEVGRLRRRRSAARSSRTSSTSSSRTRRTRTTAAPSAAGSCPPRPSARATSAGPASPAAPPRSPTIPLTGQPFPGNKIPANRLNPAGVAFLQSLPAAEQHPELGLQQLRRGRSHAYQLGPDQRPGGLEHHQQHPPDGPLHPGQLERPTTPIALGRLPDLGRRLRLGPAGQVAGRPAEPEHRVEDDEHPDVLATRPT